MSFSSEYNKLRKKRLGEDEEETTKQGSSKKSFSEEYNELRSTRAASDEFLSAGGLINNDIAPIVNLTPSERAGIGGIRTMPTLEEVNRFTVRKSGSEAERAKARAANEAKAKAAERDSANWFDAGAFEDGWQFGDGLKTIGATAFDLAGSFVQGVGSSIEGVADFILYGASAVSDLVGADDFADDVKEFAEKDIANSAYEYGRLGAISDNSVLGKYPRKFGQVLGNVAVIYATRNFAGFAGLGKSAASAFTLGTQGVSAAGNSMSEAYADGATDAEAWKHGLNAGAFTAATDAMFGGMGSAVKSLGWSHGLSQADDIAAKFAGDAIKKKASNELVGRISANFAEYGIKATAEGIEEVAEGFLSAVSKSNTYKREEDFWQLVEDENLLESFLMGAAASSVTQAGDLRTSIKDGTDFITGLTTNEEKVVNKEYENRIAEKEKGGTKLTKKEKTKLYDDVRRDFEKGYISTDTIESVYGDEDAFKTYKGLEAEEAEYKELYGTKSGDLSEAQRDRLAELKAKNAENPFGNRLQAEKDNISNNVKDMLAKERNGKGSMLLESYNERARRGQAFTADLSKYDTKQQAVIQKAIDSGTLNNTNRTHEFVDMIAKISAEKGVSFDFTNNTKLKESGFAIDGKTVNGYVTKDGITLNVNSSKHLETVTGHEITHVLEGTELYTELQNVLFEYAKAKGDYQGRYDTLAKLYKNIKDADINAELTADLVGDYLFTDSDFVSKLSVEHRNVFQKIYDEIKYLLKVATAGSKEARQLEQVKRAFEKAYKESGNAKGDTKYSLTDNTGKNLTKEQNEYFKDSKMRDDNGNLMVMYHGSQDAGFHVFDSSMSDDDTSFFFVDRNDVAASYSGTTETYEAQTIHTAEDMNNFIESIGAEGYEVVEKDGKFTLLYEGDRVADSNTAKGIYDEFCWYEGVGEGDANYKVYLNLKNPLVVDAEGKNWNNISREYSQEVADRYNSLTAEEKEALTDLAEWGEYSIFRDQMLEARATEQGGGVFDEAYTKNLARAYEKLGGANANLYDAFSIASDNFSEESIKQFAVKQMNTRDYAKKAKAEGYDGVIFKNIHDNGGYSNGSEGASTVAIAFESNQIKSVANTKPTGDADIRYSLSDGENSLDKYSQKQYNDFGWARFSDAISKNELDDMYSKIHIKGSLKKFPQTSSGEAIIEVNNEPNTTLGVDNVFVFVTGTKNNPQISRVARFQAETEIEMEIIKGELYEGRTFSNPSSLRNE